MFFSQNAPRGFMGQTVGGAACVRTEPPVTRPAENVHVPVDGWAEPVNWVRLRDAVSKSLHHLQMEHWKILIYFNLGFIFVLLAVI